MAAAFRKSPDADARAVDIHAVLDAATAAFPRWLRPLIVTRFVQATAKEFDIPGVAVGILVDGRESYASHGMTSVDNPLPVDEKTLFHLASVTKTFTATALMRLVAAGRVELDAPVRRYVPELTLADEQRSPWGTCSTTPRG